MGYSYGKRFKYVLGDGFTDNGFHIGSGKVVEILNNLNEENQKLKSENKEIYEYFLNYLNEIREEIDYDYTEMYEMVNKLKR